MHCLKVTQGLFIADIKRMIMYCLHLRQYKVTAAGGFNRVILCAWLWCKTTLKRKNKGFSQGR